MELVLSGYSPENTFFSFEKRARVLEFTPQFAISSSCLPHLINTIVFSPLIFSLLHSGVQQEYPKSRPYCGLALWMIIK